MDLVKGELMKFALFVGCNIPARVMSYELSARTVLERLGIEVVDVREFNCCGYPIRNADVKTFVLLAARNLALSQMRGLSIMTLCKCCHGSLKKAAHLMKADSSFADEINPLLAKEGLSFDGEIEITHFLEVLHKKIGLQLLKEKMARAYKDLSIATHYGCHALRPSEIMQFDNPVAPVLFDQLVAVTGAKSVDWSLKLECCGAPLLGINDDLSMDLTAQKLKNGKQAGADYLCVACPWCQMQFDHVQQQMHQNRKNDGLLPSILYPQLLGLAMGADPQTLGLEMNQIDIGNLETFLA